MPEATDLVLCRFSDIQQQVLRASVHDTLVVLVWGCTRRSHSYRAVQQSMPNLLSKISSHLQPATEHSSPAKTRNFKPPNNILCLYYICTHTHAHTHTHIHTRINLIVGSRLAEQFVVLQFCNSGAVSTDGTGQLTWAELDGAKLALQGIKQQHSLGVGG